MNELTIFEMFGIAMGFYGMGYGIGVSIAWVKKIQDVA